jgi:hypothetical protein
LTALPAVMEKLIDGQWDEIYREHGIAKD